jgi:hypothetical protein
MPLMNMGSEILRSCHVVCCLVYVTALARDLREKVIVAVLVK